jgi:hypothetical protein
MANPIPRLKVRQFSAPENKMLNLGLRRFAAAVEKKDVKGIYNPPKLRLAECSTAYNSAFDTALRKELAATLGPPEDFVMIAPIVLGIIGGIVGNIVGNIISQKIG